MSLYIIRIVLLVRPFSTSGLLHFSNPSDACPNVSFMLNGDGTTDISLILPALPKWHGASCASGAVMEDQRRGTCHFPLQDVTLNGAKPIEGELSYSYSLSEDRCTKNDQRWGRVSVTVVWKERGTDTYYRSGLDVLLFVIPLIM
jgi:hypothetical protein